MFLEDQRWTRVIKVLILLFYLHFAMDVLVSRGSVYLIPLNKTEESDPINVYSFGLQWGTRLFKVDDLGILRDDGNIMFEYLSNPSCHFWCNYCILSNWHDFNELFISQNSIKKDRFLPFLINFFLPLRIHA